MSGMLRPITHFVNALKTAGTARLPSARHYLALLRSVQAQAAVFNLGRYKICVLKNHLGLQAFYQEASTRGESINREPNIIDLQQLLFVNQFLLSAIQIKK